MNKGKTDAEFTDFLSLEFGCDTMLNRFENNIKKLQESMTQIDGMGKPSKLSSLHMTVATVNAQSPDQVEEIRTKTLKVFQRFMDLVNGPLLVTFNGIGFGDHQVVWLDQVLGLETVECLREMIDEELGQFITDHRFNAHLTI